LAAVSGGEVCVGVGVSTIIVAAEAVFWTSILLSAASSLLYVSAGAVAAGGAGFDTSVSNSEAGDEEAASDTAELVVRSGAGALTSGV
jgi:hypothetical protein